MQDIRSRIGRFAKEHPGHAIQDFTTAGIQSWLDRLKRRNGKPVSPVTRKNFAVVLGGLFEWSRKRGVIRENPCRDIERDGGRKSEGVEFWTPEEAGKLLAAAGNTVKPALVIGLFCGLRTAELCRIQWRHVNLEAGHVEVGADIAKTSSRRLVPIPANAQGWLKAHRGKAEAQIYPEHSTTLPKRISEACEGAGIRRIPNGMRHTWVTYRVALTGDVSRVALEAGNSPAVIHQHYRGLATKEQGWNYFLV
jgi:integrase